MEMHKQTLLQASAVQGIPELRITLYWAASEEVRQEAGMLLGRGAQPHTQGKGFPGTGNEANFISSESVVQQSSVS